MKAVVMSAVGGPETLKLTELPEPSITSPTEIKVRLKAAGINPVDTKIRRKGLLYPQPLPAILGCDGAGIVTEIGADVTRFKPGDKVWYCHGGLGLEPGNYAEFNVLEQRWAGLMPDCLSFSEAAALPLVLITAFGALFDRGGLTAGQTVLIHAGAGGVGSVAIPLAKIAGANVVTTVSTDEKAQFVKHLGADHVIFYRQQDFVAEVAELTGGNGADVVLDTVGAEVFKTSIHATAHFGRLITLLDPGAVDLAEARIRNLLLGFELMLTPMLRDLPKARDRHLEILQHCADYLQQGLITPCVSAEYPLAETEQAHLAIETGHSTGKIVLTL